MVASTDLQNPEEKGLQPSSSSSICVSFWPTMLQMVMTLTLCVSLTAGLRSSLFDGETDTLSKYLRLSFILVMAIVSKETGFCKFLTRLLISILLLVSGSVDAYPGPASAIPSNVQTPHDMVGSMETRNMETQNMEKKTAYQQSSSDMYVTECMEKETSVNYIRQVSSSQSSIASAFELITSEEVTSQVLMYQEFIPAIVYPYCQVVGFMNMPKDLVTADMNDTLTPEHLVIAR